MSINWEQIVDAADETGKDILSVIKPYLPALAREGPDVWEGFIKHLNDDDFTKIDEMMYGKMTQPERRELELEVLKDAYQASKARFRRKGIYKEVAQKLLIRILLRVATAGIV